MRGSNFLRMTKPHESLVSDNREGAKDAIGIFAAAAQANCPEALIRWHMEVPADPQCSRSAHNTVLPNNFFGPMRRVLS